MTTVDSVGWASFLKEAQDCARCSSLGLVNILSGLKPGDPWGLPWYDRFRNTDGGLMVIGMDFGNERTVADQRRLVERSPGFEPGEDLDKSYVRLARFLRASRLAERTYVTNSALCVRPATSKETGALSAQVYQNCLNLMRRQVDLCRPYVVAPLGNDALDSVCDAFRIPRQSQGVSKIAGSRIVTKVNNAEVVIYPLIHPSRQQNAHGWPDDRQLSELYGPLAGILLEFDNETGRVTHRKAFGRFG